MTAIYQTKKNGPLAVLERDGDTWLVQFMNTGTEKMTTRSAVVRGIVKDPMAPSLCGVGFMGIGPHKSTYISDKGTRCQTPLYTLWSNMIKRCYDPKSLAKYPTYVGYSVAEEWHNFQDFCVSIKSVEGYDAWSDYQNGTSDVAMDLDKDLKQSELKQYSQKTCTFLTKTENTSLKKRKGEKK